MAKPIWTRGRLSLPVLALAAVLAAQPALVEPALAQPAPFDPQAVYAAAAPAVVVVRGHVEGRRVLGSGFVVDADGAVLTAAHVARTAASLSVEFADETVAAATLAGYDARRDLALLRVAAGRSLRALALAPGVVSGEPVAVIGAPRGRPGVMTTGRVISTAASLPGLLPESLIRVTAEVAPGSSGGPVLNGRGEVVGLVVATNRAGEGLAVSVPTIAGSLPPLLAGARLERPWIGIAGRTLTPEVARDLGAAVDRGALILEIIPDGPGARAGLRTGDIIVAFDSETIDEWSQLLSAVSLREPGHTVRLTVIRSGSRLALEVTLGARP